MPPQFGLLANLSVSLVLALIFGLIAQRLRLSPIVGYLVAGILLGPQTPGFVVDAEMAHEFAEIGVVLLMFGVGLHFNLKDLLAVRRIAAPGAICQFVIATSVTVAAALASGFSLSAGLVLGVAVSIASTVVVIRVLMDNQSLQSPPGHVAVGWLIAQDIFTVLVLVVMPALSHAVGVKSGEDSNLVYSLLMAVIRVAGLVAVVVLAGRSLIPWLLRQVALTRSRELFTLTVLALALAVALGSSVFFGVSMALGAFLSGMVVGQTEASHQAAADALPMRDAFAVLFFVSVGMLFDPSVLSTHPWMLFALLVVVLIINPITAFVVAWITRYSIRTSLTVAALLSQIGEFSFLLADQAIEDNLLSKDGRSLLVACAIFAIAVNPWIYQTINPIENWLKRHKKLWRLLSSRSNTGASDLNLETQAMLQSDAPNRPLLAVIIGYGPVGQTACRILNDFGIKCVIIDLNLDTVRQLSENGTLAIYGDATQRDILSAAGIEQAKYLLLTIPEVLSRSLVILAAKDLNPELRIFVRARYIQERAWLDEVGATGVVTEEGETAVSLAVLLLEEIGATQQQITDETRKIHEELQIRCVHHDPIEQ
jgi:monovalent cation:H+ antiporter-2, CPA2 family